MSQPEFVLRIVRQHWIRDDGVFDPYDLCSHGEVIIHIGGEVLSTEADGSWTLSVAALFLMRTLGDDSGAFENENALVPCCGHSIWAIPGAKNGLLIQGCGQGVDWKVRHRSGMVELETGSGTRANLPFSEYRDSVIGFAKEVERFYGNPEDKVVSGDKTDIEGFRLFWREWRRMMQVWAS